MQERRQLCVAMPVGLAGYERIGLQHGRESFARAPGPVSDLGKVSEMARDLTFVPDEQDRLDVREVLVQGRPADAGVLGDLRHRHRPQPVLGYQRRGGVQDRVADLASVRLDRLVPELRHGVYYT